MMTIERKAHLLSIIKLTVCVITITLLLKALEPLLGSELIHSLVARYEFIGAIILIFYIVLSQIVAPVSGSPGIFFGLAFFGPYKTVVYIYIAELISATVNFYISRRYGRSMVIKLVGKDTIKDIDASVSRASIPALIVARLFGFSIFELVSYVFGLTNIRFRKYFFITAFLIWIPNFVLIYFMRDFDFTSARDLVIYYVSTLITGGAFFVMIKLSLRGVNRSSNESYKRVDNGR